jgi:hypothetical protein
MAMPAVQSAVLKEANPLPQLAAFKAFVAGVKDRCVEPPVTVELSQIGGYDSLG